MSRQAGSFIEGNFTRGLVTEANPLAFPANAATQSDNVRFSRNGLVTRRKGFDFETNYSTFDVTPGTDEAIVEHLWEAAAGNGDLNFVVIQKGDILYFYEVSSTGNISNNKEAFTVDLTQFIPSNGRQPTSSPCQFVNGLGRLIVVNENLNPFYVTYTPAGNDVTNLSDRLLGNNEAESIQLESSLDVTDKWIKFDYGSGNTETVTEVMMKQSTTDSHGTWKLQGSNDDSAWTDIGSSFTLGGATVNRYTEPSANATAYRYYRLLGVSGTANGTPWIKEIFLRTRSSVTTVIDTDIDRTGRITATENYPDMSRDVKALINPNLDRIFFGASTTVTTSDTITFDFGTEHSTVIDETQLTVSVTGTDSTGNYKWQASNDGSSWSDITGGSFSDSVTGQETVTTSMTNTTGYRYYRIIGVSDASQSASVFWDVLLFKRADLYEVDDQTSNITMTTSNEILNPGTIDTTVISIKTRDFVGLDDGIAVDNRPTASVAGADADHVYNLYNQGWYPGGEDALSQWDTARPDLPSNADIWWFWKVNDDFSTSSIDRVQLGNRAAPKGHYILSEFNKDRNQDSVETNTGDTLNLRGDETTVARPSTAEFFIGRVWYSGVDASGFNNRIYFSQIIENDEQFEKCYQESDPTNETVADLVDSDGGVIIIPDAGTIINLLAVNNVLLVYASNGIWTISGSSGSAFKATDFSVEKISDVNAIGPLSFVKVKDTALWWSEDGIYTAQFNQDFSGLNVSSITEPTIQETFDAIGIVNKQFVKGDYCSCSKEVHWLFNSSSSLSSSDYYKYDRVLTFNIETGAFSVWSISDSDPSVRGVLGVKGTSLTVAPVFKYLTTWDISAGQESMTFSEEKNTSYTDWATYAIDEGVAADEKDYDSNFTTGYRLDGEGQRVFNSDVVHIYCERESNSSVLVQAIRDFSIDEASGKQSVRQQAYNDNSTRKVVISRTKVRGSGRAMQLKFHSEAGKPFNVWGWGQYETINNRP